MKDRSKTYMNPYLAGFLLGLTLLLTIFFTGRGLGASGAMKSVVVAAYDAISHNAVANNHLFSKYVVNNEHSPLRSWLVFEVLGVILGAIISGALMGRFNLKVEHSPKITSRRRIWVALLGGILFGIGSQLGRGCTSGAALSGMAVLATAGFISMLAIFGSAYMFAYFFRKNWI
jgi:uncharacterized membrane protein YedE/YeeE